MIPALIGALLVGSLISSLRWLRVAQREHYLAPAVSRFALRWWRSSRINLILGGIASASALGVWWLPPIGFLGLAAAVGPIGLSLKGITSRLAWTPRLRRVATLSGVIVVGLASLSWLLDSAGWVVMALVLLPLLIDGALLLLGPIEARFGNRWVDQARAKLSASGARVVAITGSFGKTTTKGYLAHLLSGQMATVVTPASFNNRMGLARSVNEHLAPGAEVFVAEMGAYERGEIAELCRFVPPEIAVITAIGPVHLERFGSEEEIVAAKSEILNQTRVAVISIDHPLLAALAGAQASQRVVITCSGSDAGAAVSVVERVVRVDGIEIGRVRADVFASNLACAIGAALGLGVDKEAIAARFESLPVIPHRRSLSRSQKGVLIIDDTYNSNPAGARAALDALFSQDNSGRKVVVTPGMVELGRRQFEENQLFGHAAAAVASDLLVIGSTNRAALVEGARGGNAAVTVTSSRQGAVDWVRTNLGPLDAVLYENDLPDHYP